MITTIAELVEKFRIKEAETLKKQKINHGPTIGAMYEGLTKEVLNSSIPLELDLRVVSGFVVDGKGGQSKEIDCMLVTGEGEQIPHTDKYKYHIHDVVAVISVKKNLYSADLQDAYENLLSLKELVVPRDLKRELLIDAYKQITGSFPPPHQDVKSLSLQKEMIYHALVTKLLYPIRIVMGYGGFASEEKFRKSFLNYLKKNLLKQGYGPVSLPDLIVCKNFSLIKLDGMPYAARMTDDYWHLYASYSYNPTLLLLQIIWTRLSYFYGLPSEIFGDDLSMEILKPFLSCKCIEKDGRQGWDYRHIPLSEKKLKATEPEEKWEPAFLDLIQFTTINELCKKGYIDIQEKEFIEYIMSSGYTVEKFLQSLIDTRLVTIEDNKLLLLTRNCRTAILPDGSLVAGEDISGRLSRWVSNYMKERTKKSDLDILIIKIGENAPKN